MEHNSVLDYALTLLSVVLGIGLFATISALGRLKMELDTLDARLTVNENSIGVVAGAVLRIDSQLTGDLQPRK